MRIEIASDTSLFMRFGESASSDYFAAVPGLFRRSQSLNDPATEAFADRAHEPDGGLRSRTLSGALLDENRAVEQAKSIVFRGCITTSDGSQLPIHPDTLCFHSDMPNATAIAKRVREARENAPVRIAPL
jgi:lactam utilization protein B